MKKHLLIIGIVFLFVGLGFQPAFANDMSIGKVEQQPYNGTFMKTYGGKSVDAGTFCQQTSDNGFIIVGETWSFGSYPGDIYLIKTESDVGYEENKTSVIVNKEITSTIFRGPLQLPEGTKCKVFDITGRAVDPSTMKPGIYFLEVDGVVVQKVVKIR